MVSSSAGLEREIALRSRIQALHTDYVHCIDDDRLEQWPDFFTEDGCYRVITRENHDLGLPVSLIYCDGRGMLADRISAMRTANVFDAADTAQPEAPAAQADPPAPDPEPDPPAGDTEKTIAPPVRAQAPDTSQADKKAADATRRKATIADSPAVETTVQDEEDKRKAVIYEKLEVVQAELLEAQAVVGACKHRASELMAELYPHSVESDKLVDAVRGHIAAQKKIRRNRVSSSARIAEILKAAGRAPIDQAFHVQRARGMGRPVRSQVKPPGADKGDGSNANAGSE